MQNVNCELRQKVIGLYSGRHVKNMLSYENFKKLIAFVRRCSVKKEVCEILSSQEKPPVLESLFNKVVGLRPATLLRKKPQHRCFLVNFANFTEHDFLRLNTSKLLWIPSMEPHLRHKIK